MTTKKKTATKTKADSCWESQLILYFLSQCSKKNDTIAFCLQANFKFTTGSEQSLQMQNQMHVQQPVTKSISDVEGLMQGLIKSYPT